MVTDLSALSPQDPRWLRMWGEAALSWSARPRWTAHHLREVVAAACGRQADGRLDAVVAADFLGVAESTIRRWERAAARKKAHIRPDLVARLMVPAPDTELRRRHEVDYAVRAAQRLARSSSRKGTTQWSARGWLKPHKVVVARAAGGRLYQVRVVREDSRLHADLVRQSRVVIARWEPNYFAATVTAGLVVEQCVRWRVYPAVSQVSTGRTQCVLSSAPVRECLLQLEPHF